MENLQFETINVSEKTEEEIGKIVDLGLASEKLIYIENEKCGYSGYLIPNKYITKEHLTQLLEAEPMMEPLKEYAEQLQKELVNLKDLFRGFK